MSTTRALSVLEVCQRLGISRPTFYAELRRDRIQTFTIGRKRLISESALERYIAQREKATKPLRQAQKEPTPLAGEVLSDDA